MKRSISLIYLLTFIITFMLQMNINAETLLSTDKTEYTEGENIFVTAVGKGDDWVGIYRKNDKVPDVVSIRWYYVAKEGNKSGSAKNIFDSEYVNREELASLPAGEYRVCLFEDGGYNTLASAEITVKTGEEGGAEQPGTPEDAKTLITDKTVYTEGEPIMTIATGDGKDWVGLYLKTDTPETDQSIRWYYVANDGNKPGTGKNIRFAEGTNASRAEYADVPAGDYTIYLFENDKYTVLAKVDITVNENPIPAAVPEAPGSVRYDRSAAADGLADGILTITAGEGAAPDRYIAYWADSQGELKDYTAFAPIVCTGKTTEYQMVKNTLIPRSADRIRVYSVKGKKVSEKATEVMLPEGCDKYDFGDLLYEMQVISDIHLNSSVNHIHNKHFASTLEQIRQISPNSIGIFINGDIADHGEVSEYKIFNKMIEDAGEGLPQVYCSIGNHDLADGPYETRLKNFLKYTEPGTDSVYYDMWIGGVHFIFLGSEKTGLYADLSKDQLAWFREKLNENRDENRPTYVFLHQGLVDTVAGTFAYQKWHGINQAKKFAAILKDYPEAVLFSGHSHWEMDSLNVMRERDEKLPTIFSTAAVGYLWNDESMSTDVGIEGAQGYFLYAYKDRILLLGRDFVTGQWISSAQFTAYFPQSGTDDQGKQGENDAQTDKSGETVVTGPEKLADDHPSADNGVSAKNNAGAIVGASLASVAAIGAAAGAIIVKKRKKK